MNSDSKSLSLFSLLQKLEQAKIHFLLGRYDADSITVTASVPGERWEIQVFEDGNIQIERFRSDGTISDANTLDELWQKLSE
ncbi:MAG TPA: hypothetical protein VII56_01355 [Rhizomicrobium sp.]